MNTIIEPLVIIKHQQALLFYPQLCATYDLEVRDSVAVSAPVLVHHCGRGATHHGAPWPPLAAEQEQLEQLEQLELDEPAAAVPGETES